jgi:hypothetical protein
MGILGTWYNELGSVLEISSADNGTMMGTYCSAVGQANATYSLVGRYDAEPSSGGQAIGWSVSWLNASGNSHSATSWAGQYQIDPNTNQEEIYTFWLLVSEEPSSDDWSATNVGQDTFTRNQPDPQVVARARRRLVAHPKPRK